MIKELLVSSIALNVGLILGRFAGFLREALVAKKFGLSADADIVILMLTVPDLLINILIGGALGVALIPEFAKKPEQSRKLLYQAVLVLGSIMACLALLISLIPAPLVSFLAPGFSGNVLERASYALGWVIWLIPLTVLSGLLVAYLHAQNRFGIAALGTAIINMTVVIGIWVSLYYEEVQILEWIAFCVLLGGGLRLFSQAMAVRVAWSPVGSFTPLYVNKELVKNFFQATLSGSLLLFSPVVARAFASFSGDGGLALFNYASRLVEFPLAIAITFVTAVIFPRLARSYLIRSCFHKDLIVYGLKIIIVLACVALAALVGGHDAYVRAAFDYGGLAEGDIVQLSKLTVIGLLGLPLQGVVGFITAVFHARKNTGTPLLINLFSLLIFIAVNQQAVFGSDLDSIMWAMLFSYGCNVILQVSFLRIPELCIKADLCDLKYIVSLLGVSLMLYFSAVKISALLEPWLAIFLLFLLSVLSLVVLVLLNKDSRNLVLERFKVK